MAIVRFVVGIGAVLTRVSTAGRRNGRTAGVRSPYADEKRPASPCLNGGSRAASVFESAAPPRAPRGGGPEAAAWRTGPQGRSSGYYRSLEADARDGGRLPEAFTQRGVSPSPRQPSLLEPVHAVDSVEAGEALHDPAELLEIAHEEHNGSFEEPVLALDHDRADVGLEVLRDHRRDVAHDADPVLAHQA